MIDRVSGILPKTLLENGRGDALLQEQPAPHEIIVYLSSRFVELFKKARQIYESGTSLASVADQLGVAKSTVRKTLLEGGLRIRPHSGTPNGLLAKRERRIGGIPPYGYAYLDGRLTVHPKEIQIVRRITQLKNSGLSFNAIANELNAKRVAPRRGRRWDHSAISKVLRRESDDSLKRARGEG